MRSQPRQKKIMEGAAPGTTQEARSWKREPVSEFVKVAPPIKATNLINDASG